MRDGSPAGLLTGAVEGDLARSRVWREVLSRYGIRDVASAVFADQHGCWGFLDLWRDDRPYEAADADFLASLAAPLTAALRKCQARTFVEPATTKRRDAAPVVLVLDEDLRIVSHTAASRAWLDVLLPPDPDQPGSGSPCGRHACPPARSSSRSRRRPPLIASTCLVVPSASPAAKGNSSA